MYTSSSSSESEDDVCLNVSVVAMKTRFYFTLQLQDAREARRKRNRGRSVSFSSSRSSSVDSSSDSDSISGAESISEDSLPPSPRFSGSKSKRDLSDLEVITLLLHQVYFFFVTKYLLVTVRRSFTREATNTRYS